LCSVADVPQVYAIGNHADETSLHASASVRRAVSCHKTLIEILSPSFSIYNVLRGGNTL